MSAPRAWNPPRTKAPFLSLSRTWDPSVSPVGHCLSPFPPASCLFNPGVWLSGPGPTFCSSGQRRHTAHTQSAALLIHLSEERGSWAPALLPSPRLRERERWHLGEGLGSLGPARWATVAGIKARPQAVHHCPRVPGLPDLSLQPSPSCPGLPGVNGPVQGRRWDGQRSLAQSLDHKRQEEFNRRSCC